MDDSIHSFNSEKYCFLSMFPEVVYWKLVTSNKMNFVHVRKNAYFFMLTGFFKICFMLFTQRRRLQEKYRRVRFGNISYLELEKVSKQIILITKISRLNLNDIYYFCVRYLYFINFVYLYWRNGFKSKAQEIGNTVLWLEIISFCFSHIKFQLKSSHLHNFYLEKFFLIVY